MIKRIGNAKEKKRLRDNKKLVQELNQSVTLEEVKEVIRKMLTDNKANNV